MIKQIGVVGSGQMGNGITQVAASVGYKVIMMDVSASAVQKALATIESSCERLIKKEKMTAAAKAALLGNISTTTEVSALKDCDIVIEAATENIDLKLKIF